MLRGIKLKKNTLPMQSHLKRTFERDDSSGISNTLTHPLMSVTLFCAFGFLFIRLSGRAFDAALGGCAKKDQDDHGHPSTDEGNGQGATLSPVGERALQAMYYYQIYFSLRDGQHTQTRKRFGISTSDWINAIPGKGDSPSS